jgi:glycosyltransferase involved in cell wall biosynthesis
VSTLVSVVVPVYNGMPHLRDLTASILSQTHHELDIVFSDGGSSDGSAEYLASLEDPRVRVMTVEPGSGAAANWTACTLAAQADFIKLVCQDDLLSREAIEKQLMDLEGAPEAVMAIASRDIIDARGQTLYRSRGLAGLSGSRMSGDSVIRACYLKGTNVIGEPLTVLFRAEALRACMPWEDSNPLMLDLSMYSKVAPRGTVVIRRDSVGAFRVSTSSWSTRLAKLQVAQTKRWQLAYARSATPRIGYLDRLRAFTGRHLQTGLRRFSYRFLNARGAFITKGDSIEAVEGQRK